MDILVFLFSLFFNSFAVFLLLKWRMNRNLLRLTKEADNLAQHFAGKSWFVNNVQKNRDAGLTRLILSSGPCNHALFFLPDHPDAQKALSLGPMDVVEFEYHDALPNLSINTCSYLRITNIWSNN